MEGISNIKKKGRKVNDSGSIYAIFGFDAYITAASSFIGIVDVYSTQERRDHDNERPEGGPSGNRSQDP